MFRNLILAAALLAAPVAALAAEPAPPSAELERQVLEIIQRNPEAVVNAIRTYQVQQARAQRRAEWQKSLANPVAVNVGKAPSVGPADAKLTLIEFSDFQCPYCQRAQATVKTLLEKYRGEMRLVYMHLPLPMHPVARPAALAAWAAGQQGKFFEYHDRLFAIGPELTEDNLSQIARDLKLDLKKFDSDRKSPQAAAQVEADTKEAARLQLDSTPTFVLNGMVIRGALPVEDFEEAIKLVSNKSS